MQIVSLLQNGFIEERVNDATARIINRKGDYWNGKNNKLYN